MGIPLLLALWMSWTNIDAQTTSPNTCIAYPVIDSILIDGKDDESSWKMTPWSEAFIDIEGREIPRYDTRVKMLWNHTYLYFFAKLEEPHVWGTLRQRDTVIFHNNDFEVFIDPDGDTHNYYELEINALNTVWDLLLTKPYRNGGIVLDNWDINGLQSAVHIDGSLNDPKDHDRGWSLEVAVPWSVLLEASGFRSIPVDTFWRINFSRVNWQHEIVDGKYERKKDTTGNLLPEYNWVWSPQYQINMHLPERWGYVYFSSDSSYSQKNFRLPEDEQIKWFLYEVYQDVQSAVAKGQQAIYRPSRRSILGRMIAPRLEESALGWYLQVESPFTGQQLIVDQSGLFRSSP